MTKKTFLLTLATLLLSITLTACDIKIDRNEDGSLNIKSHMTEQALQTQIDLAIADPLIKDFTVEFYSGYAMVSAVRKRVVSDVTDDMSFRLDLGAQDGHLTAVISDAKVNDFPFDSDIIAVWNERLAIKLEMEAKRNPNSNLEQVSMDPDGVTMVWRVETAQSLDTTK
jgi:hypothetical protein